MIVYLATKQEFLNDVLTNCIEQKIHAQLKTSLKKSVGASEQASWKNSLTYMHLILAESAIPADAGVAIEFEIPPTCKRIDFVITGAGEDGRKVAVIVELKQWTSVDSTDKDGIVKTFVGGAVREQAHPSYQAWSYAALLEDFNEAVTAEPIALRPCAYLHNCDNTSNIHSEFYQEHTTKAPAFLKPDALKLRAFIQKFVKFGDAGKTMYALQGGKIRPSKNLADSLKSLLKGNKEFLMIDEQKVVYETALHLAHHSTNGAKNVLIVEGGPGTGKSVVAINLLVTLTEQNKLVQYVTKNAAPRAVYERKLTGTLSRTRFANLFTSSGNYTDTDENLFDALVVDEAHRLNAKSGMFANKGENQIKELIKSSRFTVFFIDEDQRIHFKDIGDTNQIRAWAAKFGANVQELKLESQFRCNGSDGYLAWVDNLLQVRKTANETLAGINYDFRVCDSPKELHDLISERNKEKNKARVVAGYCWDWASKKKSSAMDIVFPEFGYAARWNLSEDGGLWILKPDSVAEVGCIHTCQGLEVDYIGVIFGPDLVIRDGIVETVPENRSKNDQSLSGYKAMLKKNPQAAKAKADLIIKNTYRTLMTRGQKGCYVWSTDAETNEYFKGASGAH